MLALGLAYVPATAMLDHLVKLGALFGIVAEQL